jgi:putative addiction module antidote
MHEMKLRKVGNSMTVTLPAQLIEELHLTEQDTLALERVGDHIVLHRATPDFHDAWAAYESIEPRYRNANKKLAE